MKLSPLLAALFGVVATAPLSTAMDRVLPEAELPLGRVELPETRTAKFIRPGVTYVHVQRGYHLPGNHWVIASGVLNAEISEETATALRACFESAGLDVREDRFQAPLGGQQYSILSAGEFATKAEAIEVLVQLDCDEELRAGLQARHRASFVSWANGPWNMNVVVIDPAQFHGKLVSARERGVTVTSEIARAHNAPVAINAGFFHGYMRPGVVPNQLPSSSGTSIVRGEWYNEPDDGPVFFVENTEEGVKAWVEQPHLSPPLPTLKWVSSGKTAQLTGINRMPRGGDDLVALRPEIYEYAERVDSGAAAAALAVRLSKVGLLSLITPSTARPLADDDLVLLATGKWRAKLAATVAARERVALDLRVPGRPELSAFRGVPILIKDGEPVWADRRESRTSRTAAGIAADGKIYLITIDGDQYAPPTSPAASAEGGVVSVGAKISEVRDVMRWLGVENAINLDGGGSTVMVIDGEVVSSPYERFATDGNHLIERRILDALLLID
ncbi:hypothetical protein AXK11_05550 [Cephaloticoccus primus]|uniref:Phosphodiester glycosidase domain-containing protein n=1 Tax=Cephaloticoccus primus TaxID=1548207 RepID=A0A139SMK6_9BACT|nr:hypothetical protein AXK11_05550 [Cephaloticoccus primus]